MIARNASSFVFGGDAVYGNQRVTYDKRAFFLAPVRESGPVTPEELRAAFDAQLQREEYQRFLQTGINVFGTWDDHDYGSNNADGTFPYKVQNAKEYVRFLDSPKDTFYYQRAQTGKGIYGVQVWDFARPEGDQLLSDLEAGLEPDLPFDTNDTTLSEQSVAVFVLDVRSFKTPWKKSTKGRFQPDFDGDFLGEEQWNWFEEAISRSRARVNVIVQGLNVHSYQMTANNREDWTKYPTAQHRLYQAVLQPNVRNPIFVSGDVHYAQFMRKDCRKATGGSGEQQVRPLLDVVTSGMSHSVGTGGCPVPHQYATCQVPHQSWAVRNAWKFWLQTAPSTGMVLADDGEISTNGGRQFSLALNFAELEFDWVNDMLHISWMGKDEKVLMDAKWSFDELSGANLRHADLTTPSDYQRTVDKLQAGGIFVGENDWICVDHRGLADDRHQAFSTLVLATSSKFWMLAPIWPAFVLFLLLLRTCRSASFRKGNAGNNTASGSEEDSSDDSSSATEK